MDKRTKKLSKKQRQRHYYLRYRLRKFTSLKLPHDASEHVISLPEGQQPDRYAQLLKEEFGYQIQRSLPL